MLQTKHEPASTDSTLAVFLFVFVLVLLYFD